MAIHALHVMSAGQNKARFGVVKRPDVFPPGGCVTSFACEFGSVWIVVARVTGLRRKVILPPCRCSTGRHQRLVAINAGNRGVPAGQRKAGVGVPLDGEGRGLETLDGVTEVAMVVIRCRRKLFGMSSRVTVGAFPFASDILCVAAARRVALGALECGVFSFQRKHGVTVHLAVETCRLEPRVTVTSRAIRSAGGRGELPAMRILVAILASVVCDGAPEVAALVTVLARTLRVFSCEWEFRGVVIEAGAGTSIFPSVGGVASVARAFETSLLESGAVRVGMAVLTSLESQTGKLRLLRTRFWAMAFLAGH